ncbi:MAG: hypothetical protein ACPHER_02250 [Nevskiales bacterium]
MKSFIKTASLAAIFCLSSACISLSHEELEFLTELEACGISKTDQAIRSPGTAGALAALPGAGNFYLAANTWASWQWLAGAANLIFWPLSPVWAVPQTITDANSINMRETAYYYRYNPHGRAHLAKVQQRMRFDTNTSCGRGMPIEAPTATYPAERFS